VARQTYSGLGRLTIEVSRSHSDTPYWVGLLWTSDRSVTEASTWKLTTLKRHSYLRRDSNPQSQQASKHRLTS